DLPILFPALGPSAFILFSSPFSPAAAPRSVIMGHFVSIAVGYATWCLVSFASGHPVSLDTGGWPVLASASLAMAASCVLLICLACPHAPGCATALITALGAANSWVSLLGMMAGVVLLTVQAVLFSRLAGVNVPLWSPRLHDVQHG
ncbi:MAG: HPP family protein, partial [Phycisphaerae bacterium]